MSRTAPWASAPALARLAEVEAAITSDAAVAAAREHRRRIEEDALLLYAGGNVPLPAEHEPLLSAQPSMGYPGDKYQAGIDALDTIEVAAATAIAELFGARFAEVRPTSATLANLAVYTAVARPGDTIAVLAGWAGGHLSHHEVGAAGVRGLRVVDLPYDDEALDVDVAALPAFLARESPRLVVIGTSLMLRAHDVRAIAAAVHDAGAVLLYDGSHVAGLIAEGRFQAPLRDGADLMTFSTYKSFGGPAGGAIVSDDEALMARVTTAVYPGLVANYDIARLLPLAAAAERHAASGGAYADACIANATALATALGDAGLPVVGGGTTSHHVAIDARGLGGGPEAARTLARSNVLLSEIGIPRDSQGGIRIGTQSVTRQGFTPADMADVGPLIADALQSPVPERTRAIRRRHRNT